MDNIPHKRKRWNTIGFVVFIAYFFVLLGLMAIRHHFRNEFDVIQVMFEGLCIVLMVVVILYGIQIIRKRLNNKGNNLK